MSRAYDPVLDHLTSSVLENVYEPAEDTYLMCDALYEQRTFLLDRFAVHPSNNEPAKPFARCLEIGCGSGMAISYLALMLTRSVNQATNQSNSPPSNSSLKPSILATDINQHAADCTKKTFELNNIDGDVVVTDLVAGLEDRVKGQIDILLFNPPYVPTDPSEISGTGIERSWAGGLRGREVTDRVLDLVPDLLSNKGVFYCVLLSSNEPEEVCEIMTQRGFDSITVIQRRAGREDLRIVRFIRTLQ